MRLVWIYHNDRFKTLLVFGALDLIFKVIVLYVGYLPLDRFLKICRCIETSLRADQTLVTFIPFARSFELFKNVYQEYIF